MYEIPRCAGPDCNRPLNRLGVGRRPKFCGDRCRKAAQRERQRQRQAEAHRAAQLADAKATVARLAKPLDEMAFRTIGDAAAWCYASARDPEMSPADLDRAVAGLQLAAEELGVMARDYRHAADEAARLRP